MNFAVGTQAGMASGSGRPCPCEPRVHLSPVVDLIIFSLKSITIHRYSHAVAGMQLLALLHYIELQLRNYRPIHVTVVNPCLCMVSAYDLSCVLKFVKIFVLKFFFWLCPGLIEMFGSFTEPFNCIMRMSDRTEVLFLYCCVY